MKTKLTILILMLCVVCFSCEQGRATVGPVEQAEQPLLADEREPRRPPIRHEDLSEEQLALLANMIPRDLVDQRENLTDDRRLLLDEIARRQQTADANELRRVVISAKDTAKDFTVEMLDGTTITLSDLRGNVVFLNFWATSCAPCIRKFRVIPSQILEPFGNSAFVLLPISIGETRERVEGTMARLRNSGIDFNVGIDPNRTIATLYNVRMLPLSFVIDKNGIVRHVSIGESLASTVAMIEELLNE